jgi:ParB-like chromosome segregation protein Spo0J
MTTAKKLDVHPLADLPGFPEMEPEPFRSFIDDIKYRGQQEPIILYEGKILDGKNRYRACTILGKDPLTREYTGDDPIGFVLSVNLQRRHLNESQRALIGGRLANLDLGANQHSKIAGTSIEVASKLLNVGRASIERAKVLLKHGTPEQIKAVQQGQQSVSAAAATVTKKTLRTKTTTPSGEYDRLEEKLIAKLKELDATEAKDHASKTIAVLNDTVEDIVSIAKRATTKAAKLGAVAAE